MLARLKLPTNDRGRVSASAGQLIRKGVQLGLGPSAQFLLTGLPATSDSPLLPGEGVSGGGRDHDECVLEGQAAEGPFT